MKIVLNAAPDKVYSALTDPEVLRRWFCRRAVVEARAGGKYSVGWAGDYDTDWTVEECAAGRFLYLAKPEPLHFKIEAQNDGRACLSLKTQAHADQEVSARELVLWSTHLLFLKAFLEHGIDLREPDPALEFKEGYVNGAEPN